MFIYQNSMRIEKSGSYNFNLYKNGAYENHTIEEIQNKNPSYRIICFLKETKNDNLFTFDDIPF